MQRGLVLRVGSMAILTAAVAACVGSEVRPKVFPDSSPSNRLAAAEDDLDAARHSLSTTERARKYLSAASRASGLLFGPDRLDETQKERARQIHNQALSRFLRLTRGPKQGVDDAWRSDLASRGMPIDIRRDSVVWQPDQFDRLEFASDHHSPALRSDFREDGLGVPLFSVRQRHSKESARLQGPDRFLPGLQVYPVSAVLKEGVPGSPPTLELHDPLRFDGLESPNGPLPLTKDLSTPLAYQFAFTRLPIVERIQSLDPTHLDWSAGLHLLHPYEPGKIPIVFIHGYWSSPLCWLQTINELRGDPAIRSRYQFWIFIYPSMNPYLHSAAILRKSLRLARDTFDPDHADPAIGRMVLVGHSLGGVLAKTMVQEGGDRLWSLVSDRPLSEVKATPTERSLLQEVFFLRPEPYIRRVVYIATPHRGTSYSNRLFGRISARLTPHPGPLVEVYKSLLRSNPPESFSPLFREEGLATSFDQFRIGDPVLALLDQLPIVSGVSTHSIIGQKHRGPVETGTDGVASYSSTHVEGVDSEHIVSHHHFCQQEPETVTELKRILAAHVQQLP